MQLKNYLCVINPRAKHEEVIVITEEIQQLVRRKKMTTVVCVTAVYSTLHEPYAMHIIFPSGNNLPNFFPNATLTTHM